MKFGIFSETYRKIVHFPVNYVGPYVSDYLMAIVRRRLP